MKQNEFNSGARGALCRYCEKRCPERCRWGSNPMELEHTPPKGKTYRAALEETFKGRKALAHRIELVAADYSGSFWRDREHQRRFTDAFVCLGYCRNRNTPAYYAALYLFTSNEELYRRSEECFTKDSIDFTKMDTKDISPDDYALYKTAKCLYEQSAEVGADELADQELFELEEFHLAANAILISRYGLAAAYLTKEAKGNGCVQS